MRLATTLLLALPLAAAFTPAAATPSLRHKTPTPLRPRGAAAQTQSPLSLSLVDDTVSAPPPDGPILTPLPRFEWPVVLFFMANPLILLPFAALAAFVFKLQWLGTALLVSPATSARGTLLALPLLALSLVADRVIPALAEVTQASKTISLYAMGHKFAPLRAGIAALLISTSAAVAEELAFRGCLQAGLAGTLAKIACLPAAAPVALAVLLQALVFGALHSYSAKYEYLATATVGGLAFGIAFAATSNIYVPMVMHLVVDVVGFGACHWQVTRASVDEQRALLNSDAPIAKQLAAVLGPRVAASQEQAAAAAAGGEV